MLWRNADQVDVDGVLGNPKTLKSNYVITSVIIMLMIIVLTMIIRIAITRLLLIIIVVYIHIHRSDLT